MKKKPNDSLRDIFFLQELSGDSDDSDFVPVNNSDNSGSEGTDFSANSNDEDDDGDDSDDENSSADENEIDADINFLKNNTKDKNSTESKNQCIDKKLELILDQAKSSGGATNDQDFLSKHAAKLLTKLVCCACLGDRSDCKYFAFKILAWNVRIQKVLIEFFLLL
jgi:hypothetical protein